MSTLGCPSKVFYKAEDKMKIHSPVAVKTTGGHWTDYFFNYSTLGVVSISPANDFIAATFMKDLFETVGNQISSILSRKLILQTVLEFVVSMFSSAG